MLEKYAHAGGSAHGSERGEGRLEGRHDYVILYYVMLCVYDMLLVLYKNTTHTLPVERTNQKSMLFTLRGPLQKLELLPSMLAAARESVRRERAHGGQAPTLRLLARIPIGT